MALCLTCSSTLTPTSVSAGWTTPCCDKTVCEACVRRNPRLKEYDPCLYCGDPVAGTLSRRSNLLEREDVFRLEDEDEQNDEEPPAYTPFGAGRSDHPEVSDDRDQPGNEAQTAGIDSTSDRPDEETIGPVEDELEEVEVRHPISKGDTILSIARRYGADPHEILKLNDLPFSTLSTQPHLLRTRQSLVICKRRVPRSKVPATLLFDHPTDHIPDAEDAKRDRERALKRFQLLTKSLDSRVGDTYLSLSELDEDSLDFLTLEDGEDYIDGSKEGKKGKVVPTSLNREERAVEAFFDDEQWERQAGAPKVSKKDGWKRIGDPVKLGLKV